MREDSGAAGQAGKFPIPGRVLITGGGTAGHLLPGLAIASALVERKVVEGPEAVRLVGSRRGVESDLVLSTEFDLTLLPGRGFRRGFTPINLLSLVGLVAAFVRAVVLLLRDRPRVVLATGGYACLPCALAAVVLRIPLLIAEQNAVPGAASRLLGRFARAAAVSFDGTVLPRAVTTGNPVRQEIVDMAGPSARLAARENMSVGDRDLVVVFGGSLGARQINQAAEQVVADWKGRPIVVHHVVGRREWDENESGLNGLPVSVDYRRVAYETEMSSVLVAADLVVCRAGATSVAELAVLGVPSILVPLPGAPGDHQTANARCLVEAGGAVMVEDEALDGVRLAAELEALLRDRIALERMGEMARSLGRPDAADRVADLVASHGGFTDGRS